ncbi:MAG: protein-tyrosine phosphatase family protein [Pseudomonadota bacterium]
MSGSACFTVYRVNNAVLAIMPYPDLKSRRPDSVSTIAESGFNLMVSLLTEAEVDALELTDQPRVLYDHGMEFWSYPISDFGVPSSDQAFAELVHQIWQKLNQGQNVVLHCRGGVGRSGLTAAAVRMIAGDSPEKACAEISKVRGCRVPETEMQRQWLISAAENKLFGSEF